jgi:hypothetical protein
MPAPRMRRLFRCFGNLRAIGIVGMAFGGKRPVVGKLDGFRDVAKILSDMEVLLQLQIADSRLRIAD